MRKAATGRVAASDGKGGCADGNPSREKERFLPPPLRPPEEAVWRMVWGVRREGCGASQASPPR